MILESATSSSSSGSAAARGGGSSSIRTSDSASNANARASGTMQTNNSSTSSSSSSSSSPTLMRRRRLSRGLISGGGRAGIGGGAQIGSSGAVDGRNDAPAAPQQQQQPANAVSNKTAAAATTTTSNYSSSISPRHPQSGGAATGPIASDTPNTTAMPNFPKPNYSARLALSCVEHSLHLGVITKFSLCPQGKARKNLIFKAKASTRGDHHHHHRLRHNYNHRHNYSGGSNSSGSSSRADGALTTMTSSSTEIVDKRYELAEELFLRNPPHNRAGGGGGNSNIHDATLDEEYSSGDEDDLDASYDVGGGASGSERYPLQQNINNNHDNRESSQQHQRLKEERYFIPTGPDAASMGLCRSNPTGGSGGKLAFNYRKLRYFDTVSASDRIIARQFLRGELNAAKKLRSKAISNHLRRVQLMEREGITANTTANTTTACTLPSFAELDSNAETTLLATSLSRFPHELSSNLSAALLIESLAINSHESIEGMAKCYDGIVSAGTALLDVGNSRSGGGGEGGSNNSSSSTPIASSGLHSGQGSSTNKTRSKLTKSEIMGALAPLLITTLEQTSGDVIVALSKLRNYCGTRRYQRRFVQRIAPYLVRPPNAAMWCLRHQSDVEPIIAAVEMILENATEVFSQGWYERGQNMLKDTRRAESLRTAASQLRRTSVLPSMAGPQLHKILGVSGGRRDGIISVTNHEALAEWEVVALDKATRLSILDVFSRDWSRISTLNLSESDTSFSRGSQRRSGISTAKSKEWAEATSNAAVFLTPSSSQILMQSSSFTKSPRPPAKLPLSPRNANTAAPQLPSADALESTFGPSFSSQNVIVDDHERPSSPTNTYPQPPAPLSPKREPELQATPQTPPRSYHEGRSDYDRISLPNFQPELLQPPLHSSPSRGGMSAPLSPQTSIGYASVSSMGTHRSASTNQMSSTREQYLALTSTAAERKRTVAACRALRAQISQFEDSFFQMHGRTPKGAAERAPLASTYTQYREWKRAIRADAACRIQALFRGDYVRRRLMRSEDKRISDSVVKHSTKPSSRPFNHLSIPMDMGLDDVVPEPSASRTRLETRAGQRGDDNVEMEMVPANPPSPNWRNRQQRSPQQTGGSISPIASHNSPLPSLRSRNSQPDVSVMSLAELQQRKRELKQQLKLYDMNFHQQHGRMPEKREKEPIRHLYESYNAYKNQISFIEKGEAQPGPGTAAFRGASNAIPTDVALTQQNASSPTFNNSGNTSPRDVEYMRRLSSGNISDTSATENIAEEVYLPTDMLEQDLASLKAEKATLHQMLRSYEKDFYRQHRRQVSSFTDIRPVASQYRRYKEIKKEIARKSND